MGLLDKARSYREKLIIESIKGVGDLFTKKPVTIEDLKILKDYYEKALSSSVSATKFGLLNLIIKVSEDVKYFSSVESIVSSLYTVLSRVGFDVEGIGYVRDKVDVIYGFLSEDELPTFFNVNYYLTTNGKTFFKVSGEMGTFLVAKCSSEINFDEDTDMVIKKCIDILSIALRLIQFKGFDIEKFWGYKNAFMLGQIYSLVSNKDIDDKDKLTMLLYYIKEVFGLNFVIVFENNNGILKPKIAFNFPIDMISSFKIDKNILDKNISSLEVVDLDLSKFFSYGSSNIVFLEYKDEIICLGANYDLSIIIPIISKYLS